MAKFIDERQQNYIFSNCVYITCSSLHRTVYTRAGQIWEINKFIRYRLRLPRLIQCVPVNLLQNAFNKIALFINENVNVESTGYIMQYYVLYSLILLPFCTNITQVTSGSKKLHKINRLYSLLLHAAKYSTTLFIGVIWKESDIRYGRIRLEVLFNVHTEAREFL